MNAPNCYVTHTLPLLLNMSYGAGMNVCNAPPLWRPVVCTLESLVSAWVQYGEH